MTNVTYLKLVPPVSNKDLLDKWEEVRERIESGDFTTIGFVGVKQNKQISTTFEGPDQFILASGASMLHKRLIE